MSAPEGGADSSAPSSDVAAAGVPAPVAAGNSARAAAATEDANGPVTFNMAGDDSEDEGTPSATRGQDSRARIPSLGEFVTGDGGGLRGTAGGWMQGTRSGGTEDLAFQTRERMRFLSPDDQKTVCKRECQIAHKKEEQLLQQIQNTIDRYVHALEISRAVDSGAIPAAAPPPLAPPEPPGKEGPALSPELAAKYEERIRLLRGTIAALAAEPTVSLPKLTAVEQAKGFAFASYAQTAEVASRIAAAPVLGGARTAFTSFASRFRRSSFGGEGGGYGGTGSGAGEGGGY